MTTVSTTPFNIDSTLHIQGLGLVDVARTIALAAHGGDRNKHDGELYILHVNRVATGTRKTSVGTAAAELGEAVAWLHDVVEDTPVTLTMIHDILAAYNFLSMNVASVVSAVDALTKRKGEPNKDYYYRVKNNGWLPTCVKLADLKDNFSRNHMIVDEATKMRMAEKYSLGMWVLS